MRIRVQCDREHLRRALRDLVREAGHDLVRRGEDLRIAVGGTALPSGGPPTLWLCPPPERAPDADPVRALEEALARGGVAVWPEPVEPSLLLDALRPRATPPSGSVVSADAPIASSPDPWVVVDPARGDVLWANVAARRAFDLVEADFAGALREGPLARARIVLDRPEGRERVELEGRAWLGAWWTEPGGRRVLGLFELPRGAPGPDPNLRTLAELGRISATLAHEIRNPVASFAGAIDLLEGDLSGAERQEVVGLARERIDQMRTLLDDTLRLARPFKGPVQAVECRALARSAVQGVSTDPLFAGVELDVQAPGEPVHALGYEQPLHQALVNLLRNAAQAQAGRGRAVVSVRREDGRVVLRVADDGPGIPAEHRERAFEPFWTTKPSGTGLGLAYVRRAVEAGGGTVRVEDSERGAVIRIDLRPADASEGAASDDEGPSSARSSPDDVTARRRPPR